MRRGRPRKRPRPGHGCGQPRTNLVNTACRTPRPGRTPPSHTGVSPERAPFHAAGSGPGRSFTRWRALAERSEANCAVPAMAEGAEPRPAERPSGPSKNRGDAVASGCNRAAPSRAASLASAATMARPRPWPHADEGGTTERGSESDPSPSSPPQQALVWSGPKRKKHRSGGRTSSPAGPARSKSRTHSAKPSGPNVGSRNVVHMETRPFTYVPPLRPAGGGTAPGMPRAPTRAMPTLRDRAGRVVKPDRHATRYRARDQRS